MFLPNQKVTCVNGSFSIDVAKLYDKLPVEGEIYTIRDIVPGVNIAGEEGEVAVYLFEIKSPENKHGIERGFNSERFAPMARVKVSSIPLHQVPAEAEYAFA